MPSRKSPERMSLEELDAALAEADQEATEALNRKRELGTLLNERRAREAAAATLEGMSDQQRAALLEELQSGKSTVAAIGTITTDARARGVGQGGESNG